MPAARPSKFRRKYLKDQFFAGKRKLGGEGRVKANARRKESKLLVDMAEARALGKINENVDLKENLLSPSFSKQQKWYEILAGRHFEEKKLAD